MFRQNRHRLGCECECCDGPRDKAYRKMTRTKLRMAERRQWTKDEDGS